MGNGKKKDKKIGSKVPYTPKKGRSAKENQHTTESAYNKNPVWQFSIVDVEHDEWGWKHLAKNDPNEILKKLTDYESRKWSEIHQDKKRDHPVTVDKISPEARKRLGEINLGDTEQLYRLRLEGALRIWGILQGNVFKILWLDPQHTVCPSIK